MFFIEEPRLCAREFFFSRHGVFQFRVPEDVSFDCDRVLRFVAELPTVQDDATSRETWDDGGYKCVRRPRYGEDVDGQPCSPACVSSALVRTTATELVCGTLIIYSFNYLRLFRRDNQTVFVSRDGATATLIRGLCGVMTLSSERKDETGE